MALGASAAGVFRIIAGMSRPAALKRHPAAGNSDEDDGDTPNPSLPGPALISASLEAISDIPARAVVGESA